MRQQWLAYVVVGLLSIGAGVAIAGLPDNSSADATAIPPTAPEATEPTEPSLPETTAAATTVPDTAAPETTGPETTEPESTTPATTESVATVPGTTSEPDNTTGPDTTEPVPGELPDRNQLIVTTANGAGVAGAAGAMAARLEGIGYVDVVPRDGTDIFEFTTIYFVKGFEEAALRLAGDLDLLDIFVAPIENAPTVPELPANTELLAYVGLDRA